MKLSSAPPILKHGGGGNLDKIQKNSSFFWDPIPLQAGCGGGAHAII